VGRVDGRCSPPGHGRTTCWCRRSPSSPEFFGDPGRAARPGRGTPTRQPGRLGRRKAGVAVTNRRRSCTLRSRHAVETMPVLARRRVAGRESLSSSRASSLRDRHGGRRQTRITHTKPARFGNAASCSFSLRWSQSGVGGLDLRADWRIASCRDHGRPRGHDWVGASGRR